MSDNKQLIKQERNLPSIMPQTWQEQKEVLLEITKAGDSGVKNLGEAILKYQKAKELGIGWGNALPHIHTINGKAGVDTHIMKGILSRPGSGVTFELIEDFVPIYNYTDGDNVFSTDNMPINAYIASKLSDEGAKKAREEGQLPLVLMPTKEEYIADENGKKVKKHKFVVKPADYRTTYLFRRKKKDIDGKFIVSEFKSSFTWSDALASGKPYDKDGNLSNSSPWQSYRKVMMRTKPFAIGAREIANDLLMGVSETTELYETENIAYTLVDNPDGDPIPIR